MTDFQKTSTRLPAKVRSGLPDDETEMLEKLVSAIPVAAVVSSSSTRVIYAVNHQACQLFQHHADDFVELSVDDITHPEFRPELTSNYLQCLDGGGLTTLKRYIRSDGSTFLGQLSAAMINDQSDLICAVVIETDSVLGLESRLVEASQVDPLTGTLRREAFEAAARVSAGLGSFGLLFIDLNKFKEINDQYGHAVGDELLSHFGEILRNSFRQRDLIGRFGGDEFVVMVGDLVSSEDLKNIAEEFARRITRPVTVGGAEHIPLASIGAVFAAGECSFATALEAADQAMYRNKRQRGEEPVTSVVVVTL